MVSIWGEWKQAETLSGSVEVDVGAGAVAQRGPTGTHSRSAGADVGAGAEELLRRAAQDRCTEGALRAACWRALRGSADPGGSGSEPRAIGQSGRLGRWWAPGSP
eukprot:9697633-Alexandrium_andersonii.AAC.1